MTCRYSELSAIEALLRPEAQTTVFHPSEMELTKITNLVLDETRKIQPTRVVFRFAFRVSLDRGNSLCAIDVTC